MNSLGDLIVTARKDKKLTQEELAELAKVNLRTIQRVENNENTPRMNTLKLICNILEIDKEDFTFTKRENKSNFLEISVEYFFLIIINMALMIILGFMTLDSEANLNSRLAGFLMSFFIPIFIVFKTQHMNKVERLFKFGSGFLIYIISSIIIVGFPTAFGTGLLICLSICLLTLFYGDQVIKPSRL